MLEEVKSHIHKYKLVDVNDSILLAVSGGIDSMCMLHIFKSLNYRIAVAHCNFQLRGKDSDEDMLMVEKYCADHNIEFHSRAFETSGYARENKLSIQEAARNLRYNFFYELVEKHNFQKIAVAHNLNDSVETILINLIRGTSLKGLRGIAVRNNLVIRPLLGIEREQIHNYILEHRINYREDRSNVDTKYTRNKIRHIILKEIRSINPSALASMAESGNKLHEINEFYHQKLDELRTALFRYKNTSVVINTEQLLQLKPAVRYDLLEEFSFSFDSIKKLDNSTSIGKQFFSKNYSMLIDREVVIIDSISHQGVNEAIDLQTESGVDWFKYKFLENNSEFTIPKGSNKAALDADKVGDRCYLRNWIEGDQFVPLGMQNTKKLSDFFIDNKVPLNEKGKIPVLTNENDILWVVNHRIDDRYKVTANTKRIVLFEFIEDLKSTS
jgi:tRNA(Ile)-lysidine synthase